MSGRRLAILFCCAGLLLGAWRWRAMDARTNSNRTAAFAERSLAQALKHFGGALPRAYLDEQLIRLQKARRRDPSSVEAAVSQAGFLFMMSRFDAAEKVYFEALALEERAEIYANLARLYMQQNRPDDAIEPIRKAIEIDPQMEPTLAPMLDYAKKAQAANEAAEKARREREASGGSVPSTPESPEMAGLLFSEDFESGNLDHWGRVYKGS